MGNVIPHCSRIVTSLAPTTVLLACYLLSLDLTLWAPEHAALSDGRGLESEVLVAVTRVRRA